MKQLLSLLSFIVYSNLVFCQVLSSDRIYNKIVLLYEIKGKTSTAGSGFLISGANRYFLVTARHVADSLSMENSRICFRNEKDNKPIDFPLSAFLKPNSLRGLSDFTDFFAIELVPYDNATTDLLKMSSFESTNLANNNDIPRNYELITFGYPVVDFQHFCPITFKSYFASSLLDITVNGLKNTCYCYLLEHPGMEGFSGGPVVAGVTDRVSQRLNITAVVGIITGTNFDKTGGKFAIVTPTFQLLSLFK